jgi:F-type H+-transporting ATPase subunit alpha
VEKQVAILFAGVNGLLDDLEVSDLRAFEDGFYPYLESAASTILPDIATKKALDDDIKARLTAAINDYKATFVGDLKAKREANVKTAAPQATPATAMAGTK